MKRKIAPNLEQRRTEVESQPWAIYVDGKLVARADRHRIAQSIVKALSRVDRYRNSYFVCRFEAKNKGRRDESELIG